MGIEQEFLQFADLRREALLLVTGSGMVLAANRRVEGRLGATPDKLVGRSLVDFVTESPPELAAYLRACARTRELVLGGLTWKREGEVIGLRSEGAVFRPRSADAEAVVLLALMPRQNASRQFVALTQQIDLLGQEIARRRLAEQALKEVDWRKDEFLAMLAHELRNPLGPVLNAVHLLQRQGEDANIRATAVDIILRQVRHLSRLMDGLLEATRVVRGLITLERTRLDLARLVQSMAEDRRPALEQAGLKLTVQTPQTPVWIHGDATRLTQVLENLLDNARRFTDAGGRVEVTLEADVNLREATLRIRDTGVGISPEMLPRLFEVFAQADRSLERSRGGLGLGLTVVRGLVELHGGRVEAASGGPGQGAEFTVRLPLEKEPPALAETSAVALPVKGKLHVLVIEDHRDAADTLRLFLELQGHEVRVAHTGSAGVAEAIAWAPDAVISDIGLPELDGYQVAARLRANPATAGALLIAVSGYGSEADIRRGLEVGFDHYLVKPAAPEEIQRLLAERQQREGA